MKVAVCAWLHRFDTRYSVAGFTLDLCRLLVDKGIELVFVGREGFQDAGILPPGTDVRLLPDYHKDTPFDGQGLDALELEQYAFVTSRLLQQAVADCQVVITQDIVFNPQFLAPFLAVRECLLLGEKGPGWIHWSHSMPGAKPRDLPAHHELLYQPLPRSRYVALTWSGVPAIAKRYGIPQGEVRVVHNFLDLQRTWGLDDVSWKMYQDVGGPQAEVLILYPTRLDPGKRPEYALQLVKALQLGGVNAKLIMALTYTEGEAKAQELARCQALVQELGIQQHVVLSTDYCGRLGMDREQVRAMYRAADVLYHPSTQESFGLTLLEAAAAGCTLVLNQDVAAFREFSGTQNAGAKYLRAWLWPLSSPERLVKYEPNYEQWLADRCQELITDLRSQPTYQALLEVRSKYQGDWVWTHQLAPLLEESSILGRLHNG